MPRTMTWMVSWATWLAPAALAPIANTRMRTMPANPRLSDRNRQACTAGSPRATSQKRTIGSTTIAHHTRMNATAAPNLTGVETARAK